MKQILTLTVTAFQEKLYIAFMLFVMNLLDEIEVMGEKCGYYVNQFKGAYNHLNFVYLKYDVKFYTEKVQAADKDRTLAYRSLKDRVSYLEMFDADGGVKEAARILREIISLYGNVLKMKMNERTTVLTNLIEDFEGKYAAQAETTGVTGLVEALGEAQEAYMDAFMKRNEADSKYALNAMADARKMMTEAYRDLVEIVNLEAKRDEAGELTEFINRMNNEIRKNFINTGQRPASSASGSVDGGGDGESSEDENVPSMKAATFIFKNGTELKLWFVPGEPIEAPANTEGYRWDPAIPEAMPKRSKTFREVPIEAREVTLTFHFLSHEDEEMRGVVGTALTAPSNTEGCHWEPAVPSTFPEEDMTFNEVLDEPNSEDSEDSENSGTDSEETPTDPTKILLLFNDGTHNNEILKRMEVAPGYQLQASDLPDGYVYAFKADDQADLDAASPGDTVWVTLRPRS